MRSLGIIDIQSNLRGTKMKLRYITCSDPREDIPVESMLNFTEKYPIAEIGVQAHPGPMSFNEHRHRWFNQIVNNAQNMPTPPNIALHINYTWCDYMCEGLVPYELDWWLRITNSYTNKPVIKRIQLNIGDYSDKFDIKKLTALMEKHKNQEFIFPWNKGVAKKIEMLKQTGAKFSLLFDGSYGAGIEPNAWYAPVYKDVPNGYAGGLGPDNVAKNLDKINEILPKNYETWIDAEGKLRDKQTTGSFTLELAEKYLQNALAWHNQHTK